MEELVSIDGNSLKKFLVRWYGEPDRKGVWPGSRFEIPRTLRDWYFMASCWSTPLTAVNYAVEPSELQIESGKLVFWVENQGGWVWAVGVGADDPMVFQGNPNTDEIIWSNTREKLSEFLLHAMVYEAVWNTPFMARAPEITLNALDALLVDFEELALPRWTWPTADVKIMVGVNALALVSKNIRHNSDDASYYLTIAALSQEHLRSFLDSSTALRL